MATGERVRRIDNHNNNEIAMGQSQAHKLILLRSESLQPGMFVAELDRSWLHSPFPGAGFVISAPEQLAELRRYCRYVYVDPALSDNPRATSLAQRPHSFDLAPARQILRESLAAMAIVVRGARRQGVIDLGAVAQCASRLVDQVMDGREALCWLLRTEERGSLLVRRAVGTAAVAAILGRRLGMDRPALKALASGGLLLDIGKIAVPVPILAKPGTLDGAEQCYVRRHVERGLELLGGRDAPPRAVEMLAGHHERCDGSGYPHGLRATQIPLYARIAAIADVFDAISLHRGYAAAVSPHAAMRELEALAELRFDAALVNELVHALGRYPVGTPVALADGSAGFVCGQRLHQPSQPHVLLTHDARRVPLREPRIITAGGTTAAIITTLVPQALRLDAARAEPVLQGFSSAN